MPASAAFTPRAPLPVVCKVPPMSSRKLFAVVIWAAWLWVPDVAMWMFSPKARPPFRTLRPMTLSPVYV